MSALLDSILPRPEPETEADPVRPVVLTDEQLAGMDDMGSFIDAVKTEVRAQFIGLGFGNTAAGELAEIHVLGSRP